jgi:hypothetical protein
MTLTRAAKPAKAAAISAMARRVSVFSSIGSILGIP